MSRNGSSSCRALTALGVMLACLAALQVTSVRAEEVAEAWRSPFGRPRSVSVDTSDGSCWAATGSSLMHLAADGSVLSQTDGFWSPRCISANPADGSCWVADTNNNEVVHLNEYGAEIVRLGGFSRPLSLAVNPTDGSCWVADAGSDEVVHLSEDGTELLRIGCYEDPLSPAIERCFADPQSVSVNPTDNSCWIADTRNNEVVHLAEDGTELLRVGCYEDPQDPAVDKCFQKPRSLSVNRLDGSCWIADTGNNYMVHLAEDGSLLWRGPCFSSPQCVCVNPADGSCWVADTQNDHLVHLDAEGNQLLREPGYAELESVSVNPTDGSCWVADTGNSEVVHAAADGTEMFREGYFSGPQSVSANEADDSCWVADTDNDRVVQLAEDGTELRSHGPDLFGHSLGGPQSVSVNPVDPWEQWMEKAGHPEHFTCWIADTENGRIRHSGMMEDLFELELGVGGLLYPRSVSANPNLIDIGGFYEAWQCWVADTYKGQVVQILERLEDGEYVDVHVVPMPQDFSTPESVSVNRADGSCWVADSAVNEVAHLAWDSVLDGTELCRKACFSHPLSVSANWTDGSCWVADSMNDQVVHLAEDGAGLWRGGAFAFPRSVCVDTKDGSCWVADTHNNQVVHLAETGAELWRGSSFNQPYAVSVNATDGSCWVADTGNDQVVHLVITEGPPRAFFTAATVAGTAPLQVAFTDQSLRNPTSWSWDFGDGGTSDEQHPSHEYADLGVYEVTLTASNAHGSDSETKPLYITVGFSDLAADHWACGEILACASAGIVSGYDDGSYQPDNPVTRDQMAAYVSCALAGGGEGVPEFTGTPTFPDVGVEHWALDYVEYTAAQNVIAGYGDGNYHPEEQVNRAQMAVYVARALVAPDGEAGLADYVPADPRSFSDVPTDHWAYTHVEYCVENGVVSGYPDGNYYPEIVVTRDQMAVYVARAFELPM